MPYGDESSDIRKMAEEENMKRKEEEDRIYYENQQRKIEVDRNHWRDAKGGPWKRADEE